MTNWDMYVFMKRRSLNLDVPFLGQPMQGKAAIGMSSV